MFLSAGKIQGASKNADPTTDPFIANVVALLHMEGADGSTTITDNAPTPKVWTPSSGCAISTAQSKFGGSSLHFDGTANAVCRTAGDAAFAMGSGDWCIEGWAYILAFTPTAAGFFQIGSTSPLASTTNTEAMGLNGSGAYQAYSNNGSQTPSGAIAAPQLNVWTSWCLEKASGTVRLYINGKTIGTSTGDTVNYTGNVAGLGQIYGSAYALNGYLDEVRITKGKSRYAGDYKVRTTPFPNS